MRLNGRFGGWGVRWWDENGDGIDMKRTRMMVRRVR